MRNLIFLALVSVMALSAQAQQVQDVVDDRILSFETSIEPFAASKGSDLTISDAHYKHGSRSVRWTWTQEGAQLRIAAPVGYLAENPNPRETSVSTFVFWVYAPQVQDATLRFEFRKQGRTCSWFDYKLCFRGWRGAWVAFDRDMQGQPEEGMDEVVVTAQGSPRGEVFLDHLILASFQDVRQHTADFQAPFINPHTTSHWLVLLRSWNYPLPAAAASVSDAEQRDMTMIEKRLRELLLAGQKPKSLKNLSRTFNSYGIEESADGTLRGKPVWFTRYAETYINLGHPNVAKQYHSNGQLLRRYNDFMYQIGIAYNCSTDAVERNELARMYVLLVRHLLDQGYAAGSSMGTLHHLGYSMRNFYTAPVLMREVLREAGLEHDMQQAMEWFSGVGEVKLPLAEPGMDIDAFNTSLIGRLASIVMLPDTPVKARWMECFSKWVDNGFKYAPGLAPCFKSDGMVFHHRRHYPAYAVGGFDGGVNAVWLLSHTGFRVSTESHENIKRALLEMRFYCNLRSFPLALSGRHPDGKGALVPWHYARLAVAGTPDAQQLVDPELAAAYLRLAEAPDVFTGQFAAMGIAAESSPEGFRSYGYNASASHRRGNWLLTVAGHSRYLWSAEIYKGANHYGRYLTHGSVQLLGDGEPVSAFGSGFRQEGWDWCHIPGTTALVVPMEQLKADIRNVDTVSGYEEMLLSDEKFVGGVSHKGQEGLFAMKLHENDKYNGSLRAQKSWFFFGDRMIALGSDIENSVPGEVHTTLFQQFMTSPSDPICVNGQTVTTYPYEASFSEGVVLRDNLRNAYFIPEGEVSVRRKRQHSLHEETDAPTENDFTTAYIAHGGVVKGGGYEYMMAVHASDEAVAAYEREKPYDVLRRDSAAHIVRDRPSGAVAYALFEAGRVCQGRLAKVSQPLLLVISGEETLTVSVCDPDLRLYEGPADNIFGSDGRSIERSIYSRAWIDNASQPSEVRITLRGHWRPEGASSDFRSQIEGENTMLTVMCREGATRELKLVKH